MTNEDIDNWIMYHEIHKLKRLGFSISRTSRYLVIDPRTVDKYVCMREDQYDHCGRQERVPGAFLLLNRYRAGLKPGKQLPSGSYCPIYDPCFKSRFQKRKILSGLIHFTASENINYADTIKGGSILLRQVAVVRTGTESGAVKCSIYNHPTRILSGECCMSI